MWRQPQELVKTDAGIPVCPLAHLPGGWLSGLRRCEHDHEMVAVDVVFGKINHGLSRVLSDLPVFRTRVSDYGEFLADGYICHPVLPAISSPCLSSALLLVTIGTRFSCLQTRCQARNYEAHVLGIFS